MFQHHIKLWILRRILSIDLLINYVIVIHPPVASNVGMENQPRHSLLWLPLGSPPCVCRLPKSHHYAIIERKVKWFVIRDVAALYLGSTITIWNLRYTLPHWVLHEGVSTVLLRGLFCFKEFIPKTRSCWLVSVSEDIKVHFVSLWRWTKYSLLCSLWAESLKALYLWF